MNRDQIKVRMNEAKSRVREVTGRMVSDKTLEENDRIQSALGKFQAEYGYFNDELKKDHRPRKSRSFNHE